MEKDDSTLAFSLEDAPLIAPLLTPPPQLAAEDLCISSHNYWHTASSIKAELDSIYYSPPQNSYVWPWVIRIRPRYKITEQRLVLYAQIIVTLKVFSNCPGRCMSWVNDNEECIDDAQKLLQLNNELFQCQNPCWQPCQAAQISLTNATSLVSLAQWPTQSPFHNWNYNSPPKDKGRRETTNYIAKVYLVITDPPQVHQTSNTSNYQLDPRQNSCCHIKPSLLMAPPKKKKKQAFHKSLHYYNKTINISWLATYATVCTKKIILPET